MGPRRFIICRYIIWDVFVAGNCFGVCLCGLLGFIGFNLHLRLIVDEAEVIILDPRKVVKLNFRFGRKPSFNEKKQKVPKALWAQEEGGLCLVESQWLRNRENWIRQLRSTLESRHPVFFVVI